TEVHIEAIPEDKDATVEIIGDTKNLEVGVTRQIQVVVTAPKGNQKTYTLSITRQEATTENLALFKLETNRGELTPTFSPDTLNYTLEVENNITDITVTAEALSNDVTVTGTGKYNLKVGKNGITVFVVGNDEVQRNYQIVVTRKKSKDATLSALVVKGHTLSPKFNKNTVNYTLTTSGNYLDFTTIQPTESESTYVVSGNENFETGENIVTIEVTAPDGETKKTYTLTVAKSGSKNNNLATLEVEGYTLKPVFHKGVTFYSVDVPNNVNSVIIKATAEDNNATITGVGLKTLKTGENYFNVVVTSEEGTTKTYTILVTKEASNNNYLGSLFTSDGTLNPEFNKETLSYEITVPYTCLLYK
ncbi:MAG: cadherin-like beta sandwich domain-containing protein, partial [Bacilli bacterium]|nr:cadherin-like beta sandwich domain-containing protein [Bacilli bacterium]